MCLSLCICRLFLDVSPPAVEWTPTKSRATVSMVTGYSYSAGQFVLVGAAYAIRDWRWLQLATSFPFFAFFLYGW